LNLKGLYNRFLKIKKAKNHISNYIDKHHIDLLYTSTSVIISGGLAAKKRGIPSISLISTKYQLAINFTKYLLVCFCDIFQQKLLWFLIVLQNTGNPYLKKNQLTKVYNGIIFPITKTQFIIQKETLQNITVTSIARLIPYKGHKYFIEVAKELFKLNNQYQFLIVGDTFPGYESYEEELKVLVSENDLHQKYIF